jgi:crotonobetainyl-CoA:carnitine CoA-transferase CaiB-like acyl-CoA transferase
VSLPLAGIRVLELAEYGFVPSAAAVLADWGADVVKVERPGGDPLRSHARMGLTAGGEFDVSIEHFNRNKRGIVLDLRNPKSRPVLERLVRRADVALTSFLPDARQRLRVDVEHLRALNPAIIYARGSGYGPRGPDAGAGGFDAVSFWSRGGVAYMLSPPEGPLTMPRPALGDGPCGMFLAGGIAAALARRALTGEPSVVDVSLLAGAVWTLAPDLTSAALSGEEPARPKPGASSVGPLLGPYRTCDGRFVQLNMLDAERWWDPACRALGLDELAADARYRSDEGRRAHSALLRERFAAAIERLPREQLRARLQAEGCIFALVASPTEVVVDPQVLANGYLAPRPGHPVARLASSPVQFDEQAVRFARAAPRVGEHTAELLAELGFAAGEQRELAESGVLG